MKNTTFIENREQLQADLLVIPLFVDEKLSEELVKIDQALQGGIAFNIKREEFIGQYGRSLEITTNGKFACPKVILIGLGKRHELTPLRLQELGSLISSHLAKQNERCAALDFQGLDEEVAAAIVLGMLLRRLCFNKYRSEKQRLIALKILCNNAAAVKDRITPLYQGSAFARELTAEPANILYPEAFAERCLQLQAHGITVSVLDEEQLEEIGAHALLAVGAGSSKPPRLVAMQWNGASPDMAPVALIGKGVCFDAGGINIKTEHLTEMKWDKAAAAAVSGTLLALALMKAPVNVVGVIGLTENMPDGNALKPGDVISTLSGKTVEVVDTDNEGRLVLADCLAFAQQRYAPSCLVDLGTLTLEVMGALAGEYAGLFCEDSALTQALMAAGDRSGERLWSLPMGDAFAKQIASSIADVKNMGVLGFGESSAAAEFLKCFVRDGTPWAHIDIAGVAWSQEGVSGFGVRLLTEFVLSTAYLPTNLSFKN